MLDSKTKVPHHPTGRFVIWRPMGDAGLTGRKIIVDTYGGYSRHGGGAFSGKGSVEGGSLRLLHGRYIAKNIVAAASRASHRSAIGLCHRGSEPVSVMADTFGTATVSEEKITSFDSRVLLLTPKGIHRSSGICAATDQQAHGRLRPLWPQWIRGLLGSARTAQGRISQGRRPERRGYR